MLNDNRQLYHIINDPKWYWMKEIMWLNYISHNSPTLKDAKSMESRKEKSKCKDLLVFFLLS